MIRNSSQTEDSAQYRPITCLRYIKYLQLVLPTVSTDTPRTITSPQKKKKAAEETAKSSKNRIQWDKHRKNNETYTLLSCTTRTYATVFLRLGFTEVCRFTKFTLPSPTSWQTNLHLQIKSNSVNTDEIPIHGIFYQDLSGSVLPWISFLLYWTIPNRV